MTMLSHEMPAQRFAEIEPLRVFHTLKIWHAAASSAARCPA